ncbi:heme/hemin ABC transporter substrate-binding protein [Roseicitreum antarcticum]|uniref:Iron complex transport system substrate-binding protein n=1 Tax=Roseicitreum antarcticum TaxID=564137 RepID=A0A1H2U969_9RHOB|nr:ABC transporter substrate-binding protein [Roseicitreum antarcticum]SDW52725.1 iron complex transport system substrate-binding protein [Roseicitreum antarcticum]
MIRSLLAPFLLAAAVATPVAAQDRVVVVGGGLAEIVYALGQEDRLVGRDTTASFPPAVNDLPDVGYMRALSPEGLLRLDPDLIIASEGSGPPETIAIMQNAKIPFVQVTEETSVASVMERVSTIAQTLDAADAGRALVARLQAQFDDLSQVTAQVSAPRRVMFILSAQDGRINTAGAGTGAEAMIELAGAVNAFDDIEGYRLLTDEAIAAAAPDVILMMDRDGAHALSDDGIRAHPALGLTPAAQSGRIVRMDGIFLLGFGPRTAEAARALHDAVYPTTPPRQEG